MTGKGEGWLPLQDYLRTFTFGSFNPLEQGIYPFVIWVCKYLVDMIQKICRIELDDQREIRSGDPFDPPDDLDDDPGAAGRGSAPFVRPPVGVRRNEAAEEITVGDMDLRAVESRFLRPPPRLDKIPDGRSDVRARHFARRGLDRRFIDGGRGYGSAAA